MEEMPRTRCVGRAAESPAPSPGAPPSRHLRVLMDAEAHQISCKSCYRAQSPAPSPSLRLVDGAESSRSVITWDQPHPEAIQGPYLCHLTGINSGVIKRGTLCITRHSNCSGNSKGVRSSLPVTGDKDCFLYYTYIYIF